MDIKALRNSFTSYMKERYPNDNNVSSTVSMAFALERYGDEFEIDFHRVLVDGVIPDLYKRKLEDKFTRGGRKSPRGNAAIYERALRILLEYMSEQPTLTTLKRSYASKVSTQKKTMPAQILKPTKQNVSEYLTKWEQLNDYPEQEKALNLLFRDTFLNNNNISEVLLKCSTLNDFYGTNIFRIYPVAKHIVELNIDKKLTSGDPKLVNNIASGHGIKNRHGTELKLFSFATKYCSHHNPEDYPIYDSYVEKILLYFRRVDNFSVFSKQELRDYHVFKRVIIDFCDVYGLQGFTLKQIDQYLWQLGKEAFHSQRKNELNTV